ncbi:MAG: Fe-S cluster assembly sulfur transfer protein SufU [Acidobacteriota bacterium]
MSAELGDLYQELIVDHGRRPRNFRAIPGADWKVEGYNPLCGDKMTIYVKLEDDVVKEIGFQGAGCAISTASASMLTESVKGKTRAEAEALFQRFHALLTGQPAAAEVPLGKLAAFSGVCDYPTRVKCATLAWHALHAALEGKQETVSTER